jgi:hypothetical protein
MHICGAKFGLEPSTSRGAPEVIGTHSIDQERFRFKARSVAPFQAVFRNWTMPFDGRRFLKPELPNGP